MKHLSRAGLPAGLFLIVFSLAGAAAPQSQPASKAPAPPSRPNLVLITAEGLRPDRLSCYKAPGAAATPNIDSLALEGRLFQQVLSSSVSTTPALATLLTGRTSFQHGVWDDHYRNRLPLENLTLAERLKKEGYRTAAFVGTSRLAAERGLDQGFELYQDGYATPPNGVWKLTQRLGTRLIPAARSWLEGSGQGPLFLWVHLIETSIPAPRTQTQSVTAAEQASYANRVTVLDEQVGGILKVLKELELYQSSIVVLSADHGMALGEHGEWRAGVFVYEGTVRVPLLIKTLPGDDKKGSRSGELAGTVDLFPTLERLLGLVPTPGLPGRDLLAPVPSPPPSYYASALLGREMFGWREQELVARGSRRWITGTSTALYDLSSDPREEKDLGGSASKDIRELQEMRGRIAGKGTLPPAHFQPERGLPPEIASKVVELGYVPPTPEKARAVKLRDPRAYLHEMRLLEIAVPGVDLIGFDAAAQVRDTLLSADPEGLFTLVTVAQLDFSRNGKSPEGLSALEKFLKKAQKNYPLEPEIYHLLGHVAFERGAFADSELFYQAGGALSSRNAAEISYDLACSYAREGKKEAAISELRRAIRLGFRDATHISRDTDLEGLREVPAYKSMIQEELPAASRP